MVQKAMNQLLFEVSWPKLDLLVLDLPPGTGDVQLTITQSIELAGEYEGDGVETQAANCSKVLSLSQLHKT